MRFVISLHSWGNQKAAAVRDRRPRSPKAQGKKVEANCSFLDANSRQSKVQKRVRHEAKSEKREQGQKLGLDKQDTGKH